MDQVTTPAIAFVEPSVFDEETLQKALLFVIEHKGDDLILQAGYPFGMIWAERVVRLGHRNLNYDELRMLLNKVTDSENSAMELQQQEDIDFNYVIQTGRNKTVRFRVNATGSLGRNGGPGIHMVFRPGSKIPPTMDEIGLPKEVQEACMPKSGIVIVTGPTGSGKTTTLDSIMRALATHPEGRHILTYYAPIENDLMAIPDQTGFIAQAEIGKGFGAHLRSFERATRNSLRRHPQVIVYGEARDKETIDGAVLSAQTGHATYTTTHTSNVHMSLARMADAFPGSERVRITNALIDNSRMILHQRLLKRPDGAGRAPVRSWLVLTQDVRSELLRCPVEQVPSVMQRMVREVGRDLWIDAQEQYDKGLIHSDEMVSLRAELEYAP